MNNGTHRVFLLLLIVVVALAALQALPPTTIGSYEVKPVHILSDIRPADTVETVIDLPKPVVKPAVAQAPKRPVPKGMVCIEDYGGREGHGMSPFYQALKDRAHLGRPVRIAYFGDSFIEGDILTADLRTLLQQKFGGCGVGFVDMASPFTPLRPTVRHSAQGFTDHNVMNRAGYDRARLSMSCRYAVPGRSATATFAGVKAPARLDSFDRATLYLSSFSPVRVSIHSGDTTLTHTTHGDGSLEAISTTGRSRSATFSIAADSAATCYGVALEGEEGIVLDNFSLRGSSGIPLASIPQKHLAEMNAVRPYDLIVLQFGLNVASKKQMKYDAYVKQMKRVVQHFKQAFPAAGILIVSVGDREDKIDGELRTMPGVKALVKYQQLMASEEEVAFWNLYEGMGGEGAIRRMADTKPAEAGKDYTHINRRGGKRIAGILYKTLLFGYAQY